jgi:hypothetical protein
VPHPETEKQTLKPNAIYYALSGIACAVYYRHEITKSAKNLLLIGVGPGVGALMLGYLFVEATRSLTDVEESSRAWTPRWRWAGWPWQRR